jgi:hypothetical protein
VYFLQKHINFSRQYLTLNIYRDSILALLVASAIGYASLSMAGIADTEQSVRGDKAVYGTNCKDTNKTGGECTQR